MENLKEIFSSDKRNRIILAILLFVGFAAAGLVLTVTYITDETGTMANAAFLAGYDWSNFIDNTGGYYYKYGQALLWYPLFALVKDSFVIYKLIMLENAVLLTLEGLCIYQILRKHLKVEEPLQALLLAAVTAITPAAVIYSLFARADVILVTFSVYVLYFLMEAWSSRGDRKKQAVYTFLTVLCTVYIAMCHSRGIVWVIAVTMVVLAMHLFTRERMVNYWVYGGSLVVLMGLDKLLTKFFKANIWGDNVRHASAESFDFSKLKLIFTGDGLKTMVKLGMGWLFNFMTSSMGLAVAGIFVSIVIIWLFMRGKKQIKPEEAILCGYGFLIFAGSMALGMLFFFPVVYRNYYEGVTGRMDRLVYDRYLAGSIGIAVLMGLYFFIYRKDIFQKVSRGILAAGSLFILLFYKKYISIFLDHNEFSIRNSIASNLFVDNGFMGNDAAKFDNMSGGLFYGGLFACAVLIIFLIAGLTSFRKTLLGGVFAVFLISLTVNYSKMRLGCDINVKVKMENLQEYAKEIRGVSEENRYIYIDKTTGRYKPLQLIFKEFRIYVRAHLPEEEVENYFIISKKDVFNPELNEGDCYQLSDFDYENAEYYVIYVKGEGLKEELEQMGKDLEKVQMEGEKE